MSLRKISNHRGSFPTDESALKLLYLVLRNITQHWTMPIKDWRAALNRFAIIFGYIVLNSPNRTNILSVNCMHGDQTSAEA